MMRHRMMLKKGFCAFFLLVSCLSATTYGSDQRKTEPIKVAVLKNFPPQYLLSKNGEPQGFAIDIIKEIAKLGDFKIEYLIKDDWTEMFEAVKSGQADLIPNMGITERRKEWFVFSLPVETFPVSIFARAYERDISDVSSLNGKKVAVIKLNVGEVLIEKRPGIHRHMYDHIEEALFGLLSGNVDALIYPEPVLWKLARDARIENKIKVVGQPLTEVRRAISVAKGNTALLARINRAVNNLVEADEYQKIYTKWYGRPRPYWTAPKVVGVMGAIIIAVVLIMGFWRYHSTIKLNRELKKNIEKRKTAENKLQQSYETLEQKVDERTRDLQIALKEVKTLSGLLPICSFCKKIRDDQGYWNQIEAYIREHSEAEFSHSICKECAKKHYPDFYPDDD